MLDPFLPEKPEDVEKLKAMQREIHENFIALVQERRGAKLNSRETALFSGAYWTGQRGRELGLADGIGDLRSTLRERYGDKVRMPLIAERGFVRSPDAGGEPGLEATARPSLADEIVATLEARALWSRYDGRRSAMPAVCHYGPSVRLAPLS